MGETSFKYAKYCTPIGKSKPISLRIASSVCKSLRWPIIMRAGSDGKTVNKKNTNVTTPNISNKPYNIFLTIYRSIYVSKRRAKVQNKELLPCFYSINS